MEYEGKTYRTEKELIIKLRKDRMTYAQIGKIIRKSAAWVGTILNEAGLSGRLLYPELEREETFFEPDELIAAKLNIKQSRVSSARKKVGNKNPFSVKLHSRRRHLVLSLFGKGYSPGPKFSDFIKDQIETLTPKKRELIETFYLEGQTLSLADDINLDHDRVYRSVAKQELKKKLEKLNPMVLVKKGVLRNGRSHSESN